MNECIWDVKYEVEENNFTLCLKDFLDEEDYQELLKNEDLYEVLELGNIELLEVLVDKVCIDSHYFCENIVDRSFQKILQFGKIENFIYLISILGEDSFLEWLQVRKFKDLLMDGDIKKLKKFSIDKILEDPLLFMLCCSSFPSELLDNGVSLIDSFFNSENHSYFEGDRLFRDAGTCQRLDLFNQDVLEKTKNAIVFRFNGVCVGYMKMTGEPSFLSVVDNLGSYLGWAEAQNKDTKGNAYKIPKSLFYKIKENYEASGGLVSEENSFDQWPVMDIEKIWPVEYLPLKKISRVNQKSLSLLGKSELGSPTNSLVENMGERLKSVI